MNAKLPLQRDFRLLDALWPRERSLDVANRSRAAFFIVRREFGERAGPRFHVVSRRQAIEQLARPGPELTEESLGLHALPADPAVPLLDAKPVAGLRQVVTAGTVPVGFLEALVVHRGAVTMAANVGGAAPVEVRRELNARWPGSAVAGKPVSLLVSLASLGAGSATAELRALVGSQIDIIVLPLEGMTLDGTASGSILVQEPQPDRPLVFALTAGEAGHGAVRIYAASAGVSVAALELHATIVADGAVLPSPAPPDSASATIPATPRNPPDLTMLVIEAGTEIRYRLQSATARLEGKDYPPVPMDMSSRDYFGQFCRDIEKFAVKTVEDRTAAYGKIGRLGANLFGTLLPEALKQTLWDVYPRIGTVQITSDEAWIPWEVFRLAGRGADGKVQDGPFFAQAFSVTRWLHGVAAPTRFRFGDWALVVPNDSRLPLAKDEAAYVRSLRNAGRRVTDVPATLGDVTSAMEDGRYQAWHFCGHAHSGERGDGDRAAIELENRETLRADEFAGSLENALEPRPFIFLNACQSAQGGPTLTGVGGWAQRFLKPTFGRHAAAAFIGSYWSVYDDAAHGFATGLYDRLFTKKQPIGQAVREARNAINTSADPLTWLAYTVYADPAAVAEVVDHAED